MSPGDHADDKDSPQMSKKKRVFFKLEKAIPIPKRQTHFPRRYPWAEMEVGDSFFVNKKSLGVDSRTLGNAGNNWAKRHELPNRYSCRKVPGGVRVWRIE